MYHFPHQLVSHHNNYNEFLYHSNFDENTLVKNRQNQTDYDSRLHQNNESKIPEPQVLLTQKTLETATEKKASTRKAKKGPVDTSNFTVEERLVAAVWVHERKNTKCSINQIKQDFRQRFRREPPSKNTLLIWERKLFSTGSVHDALRPGRPIKRASAATMLASMNGAPALSVRARARALCIPRTTLRTILIKDLGRPPTSVKTEILGKQMKKRINKKPLQQTVP